MLIYKHSNVLGFWQWFDGEGVPVGEFDAFSYSSREILNMFNVINAIFDGAEFGRYVIIITINGVSDFQYGS